MKHAKRFCPHCRAWFEPDPYNAFHQVYCAQDDGCRSASHRVSSERNRVKTRLTDPEKYREQQEEAKKRVSLWRLAHPKYWRRSSPKEKIQENLHALHDIDRVEIEQLRDIVLTQMAVLKQLIGLLTSVT